MLLAVGLRGLRPHLNQTNISANNNKFYIIQLLEHDGAYSIWIHWGRMVSPPQHHSSPPPRLFPPCLGTPKGRG